NATWSYYREKTPERAAREIDTLINRHDRPDVIVVDNVLRQGGGLRRLLAELLRCHAGQRRLVLEAKASLRPSELCLLRLAGVQEMQVGIESLSTGMLRTLINKGTSTLQNVQAMRWMDDLGIRHVGNIILYYPGAAAAHLAEMLRNIDF